MHKRILVNLVLQKETFRLSDERKSIVTVDNSGRQHLKYEDVIMDEDSTLVHSIDGGDRPLSATADIRRKLEYQFFASDATRRQQIDISTSSVMTSDFESFRLVEEISVDLNGEKFFSKKMEKRIPRDFV